MFLAPAGMENKSRGVPLYPNRPYRCWRGNEKVSKDELSAEYRFVMAYENFRGRRGYISEKIFDALQAGSVPVYLGEERIAEFVPPEAFVDARNFRTRRGIPARVFAIVPRTGMGGDARGRTKVFAFRCVSVIHRRGFCRAHD